MTKASIRKVRYYSFYPWYSMMPGWPNYTHKTFNEALECVLAQIQIDKRSALERERRDGKT